MKPTLRMSDAAAIALHTAAVLAAADDSPRTVGQIARRLGVSQAHLSKVLQRLDHAGLVDATRGRHGGFRLARPAEEVSLLEVYESIDGPLENGRCLLGRNACLAKKCILGDLLHSVNRQVKDRLASTMLVGLARNLRDAPPTRRDDSRGPRRRRAAPNADRRLQA